MNYNLYIKILLILKIIRNLSGVIIMSVKSYLFISILFFTSVFVLDINSSHALKELNRSTPDLARSSSDIVAPPRDSISALSLSITGSRTLLTQPITFLKRLLRCKPKQAEIAATDFRWTKRTPSSVPMSLAISSLIQ